MCRESLAASARGGLPKLRIVSFHLCVETVPTLGQDEQVAHEMIP